MRVTLLISSLGAGGAERVMVALAGHWLGVGHEVSLITLASKEKDFYPLPMGVQRYALDMMRGSYGWRQKVIRNFGRLLALRACIRLTKPDVIISFTDVMNVQTLIATRFMSVPVIVSERVDPRFHSVGQIWDWLRARLYPCADVLVVQTRAVERWVAQTWHLKKVKVLPNPVSRVPVVTSYPDAIPDVPYVASVGRMVPQKGFDLLLRAFAIAGREFPDWKLVILGDGHEKEELCHLTKCLGLTGRVVMPGKVPDIWPWLDRAELFALSSRYEGFPNALLEAMVAGLPVVCFDCPSGPSEIVRPGVDGLMVPVGDVDGFANALVKIMSSKQLRDRMGAMARQVSERFSSSRIMREWDLLLGEVTES